MYSNPNTTMPALDPATIAPAVAPAPVAPTQPVIPMAGVPAAPAPVDPVASAAPASVSAGVPAQPVSAPSLTPAPAPAPPAPAQPVSAPAAIATAPVAAAPVVAQPAPVTPAPATAPSVDQPWLAVPLEHSEPLLTYGSAGEKVRLLATLLARVSPNYATNNVIRGLSPADVLDNSVMADVARFRAEYAISEDLQAWQGHPVPATDLVGAYVGPHTWHALYVLAGVTPS